MKKFICSLLFFLFFFENINCLFFQVHQGKTECISQNKKIGEEFKIKYYLSGQKEEGNLIIIYSPSNKKIWEGNKKKNDKLSFQAIENGYHRFCVTNNSKGSLTVTFQFPEEIKTSQLLSTENIDEVSKSINEMNKKLNNIQFNIRNNAVRRGEHSKVTQDIRYKISIYNYVKITFWILFSIFQICIVTTIFKDFQIVNKISINTKSEISKLKDTEQDKEIKKKDVYI